MDQLFYLIIRDTYIKNQICYFIRYDVNYKTTNTQYYVDADVMIKNNHLYLLKSKLKRNEYVCSKDSRWLTDSSLISNDLDLFIQCYKRFAQNESLNIKTDMCAQSNNWRAFKYIFQDCLEDRMFENLVSRNKLNFIKCLEFGVDQGDMGLVLFVFSVDDNVFERLKTEVKERLLTKALMSGNVELFKIIRKQFEESLKLSKKNKQVIYHKKLLRTLVHCSKSSVDMYYYIQMEYGIQFNMKENLLCDILIPLFSRLNASERDIIIKPMLPNLSFSSKYANDLVWSTLVAGHYEVYTYVKDQYNFTFKPPTGVNLDYIKNAFDSLDNVKFLVETVGIDYGYEEFKIATKSTEIFNYLYDRRKSSCNGAPIFNSEQKRQLTLLFCGNNSIQRVLTSEYTLLDINVLIESARKISNVQTFKLIYNIYISTSTTMILYEEIIQLFNNAISGCRLATLKYLVDRHRKTLLTSAPSQLIDILSLASKSGSVQILEYLLHETGDRLKSVGNETVGPYDPSMDMIYIENISRINCFISFILSNAIKFNHYDCVKFIISSFPKNLVKLLNSEIDLAMNANLLMVKLIYSHPSLGLNTDFSYTLEQAQFSSREIYDYLYEHGVGLAVRDCML